MRTRIPLPDPNNDPFKDAFDYFEQIQKRKSLAQQSQNELAEKQREFGMTNALDQQKLAEISGYHKAMLDLKSNGGPNKLTAQEQNQAMKLLEAGRSIQSIASKGHKLKGILEKNPNLTGWGSGIKSLVGAAGDELGGFNETAGQVQAGIGRLASQRGGAQVLRWAEKVKPGAWKSVKTNQGMVDSMIDDAQSDYNEAKSEYEDLTGKPYPVKFPERILPPENAENNQQSSTVAGKPNKVTKWKLVNGKLEKE